MQNSFTSHLFFIKSLTSFIFFQLTKSHIKTTGSQVYYTKRKNPLFPSKEKLKYTYKHHFIIQIYAEVEISSTEFKMKMAFLRLIHDKHLNECNKMLVNA